VKAPTRALIVEDIESWIYTLTRAARRAGASEIVECKNLQEVRDALRVVRFDVAILDIGLDPDDDLNADGIKALEAIREIDSDGTRCVLVTGWEGGDRMSMQAKAQQALGVDWAYMKEKYEAHTVIDKLTELLEQGSALRLAEKTPMENLRADVDPPYRLDDWLINALSPTGGVQTIYSLVFRLLSSASPLIAKRPSMPLEQGPDGACVGLYWSRSLGSAVGVALAPTAAWSGEDPAVVPESLARLLPPGETPDLNENVRERNIMGRLWEVPSVKRDEFPG
jgi:ActR/RegA family two-component response regulator